MLAQSERSMLQISILFILIFATEALANVTTTISTPTANNAIQKLLVSKNGLEANKQREDWRETGHSGLILENTELAPQSSMGITEGAGRTLEQCFGGLGRWLNRRRYEEKYLKKRRKVCCRCCKNQSTSWSSGVPMKHGIRLDDVFSGNGKEAIGSAAGDSSIALQRSSKKPTKARLETLGDSPDDAVSGLWHYKTERPVKRREKTYRKSARSQFGENFDECSCDICMMSTFLLVCGAPVAALGAVSYLCCKACKFGCKCVQFYCCDEK